MAFDQSTRNRLQKFVSNARAILGEEFTRQLQATYGLDPKQGTVAAIDSLTHLDNRQRQTAHLLRETLAHYLATTPGKGEKDRTKQVLDRIVREQAFTVLNRLAALRMAEARGFLLESIAKAHSSKGFQLYRQLSGTAHGETGDAYRNYLFSLFDEFSLDLAVLFDRHSAQGRLFPRESALLELLAEINHHEIEHLWAEDETIGWIYQYFNSQEERKKMRAESQAPRNSRELAVRNQFFTPRYVVEFLTDNTLGRIWFEMTQGNTALVEICRYLVRRPTEIFLKPGETAPVAEASDDEALSQEELLKQPVYIPHRPLKDPRSIRMLDPACGSMHFGLYAFDLFERIYLEAWQLEQQLGPDAFTREVGQQALQSTYESLEAFKQQIPKLIIEHNIHGVDIDPRAVQIAGLSLWQRAQRAWHQQGIKPQQRPTIVKSNIVCAEPMPGEKALLQEFTSKLNPPVLGQLLEVIFDKMQLAGEAGTLLRIEEEMQTAIHEAREQWLKQSGSNIVGDLFQVELDAATPQTKLGFDLRGIDDETFWDDAEQRILQALSDYAEQAESNADQKRLFADDAAKGFAFIDLSSKHFDIALMNPPFGEFSKQWKLSAKEAYPNTYNDIFGAFTERMIQKVGGSGLVGSITSRTCFFLSSFSGWREEVIISNSGLALAVDLGESVMDDAMVESAAYVIGNRPISNRPIVFRTLTSKNRSAIIDNELTKLSSGMVGEMTFICKLEDFSLLNGSPFAYWVLPSALKKLHALSLFKDKGGDVKVGLQTGDDFRFCRLEWEFKQTSKSGYYFPLHQNYCEIGDNVEKKYREHFSKCENKWFPFVKSGSSRPWYSPITLYVNYKNDGYELRAFKTPDGKPKAFIRNESNYFFPGFSWTRRANRFYPYYIEPGCIPSVSRYMAYPFNGNEFSSVAFAASNIASSIMRLYGEKFDRPNFLVENLKNLRIPKLSQELNELLASHAIDGFTESKSTFCSVEPFRDFIAPNLNANENVIFGVKDKFSLLGPSIDERVTRSYMLNDDESQSLLRDLLEALSCESSSTAEGGDEDEDALESRLTLFGSLLSYALGVVFGRWNILYFKHENRNPNQVNGMLLGQDGHPMSDEEFDDVCSNEYPITIIFSGVSDIDSLVRLVKSVFKCIEESSLASQIDFDQLLDDELIFRNLENKSMFFDAHMACYSKSRRIAPIYWPLQTPSSSYTLWVYYHRLNEQTLYTCVNDFVEPKLAQVEQDLNGLRSKSARSNQEEKELEKLSDLVSELRDFRDELLRLAKFWKPNLNDGVQITAAPLWKLFQHKAWQKKLKETWESLEKGDYDWAHLACSIWPERVLRKCHQDRSLAIAHDVEAYFWHEVEVPVKRGKKLTGATKLEWQSKDLNEPALLALIKQIKEERGL